MTVACRVDDPHHTGTPDHTEVEARLLAACAEAILIEDPDALIEHLARTWREATHARMAVLAIHDETARGICYCAADSTGVITRCPGAPGESAASHSEMPPQIVLSRLSTVLPSFDPREWERRDLCERDHPDGPLLGILWLLDSADGTRAEQQLAEFTVNLLQSRRDRDRVLRDSKLTSLGEFAAGAGHEINNPLAAISGRAQLLLRNEQDPERKRHLTMIAAQALRIRDMIGDVMLFARPPEPDPGQVKLSAVLDTVLDGYQEQLSARSLNLTRDYEADLIVWADENQLRIVIGELLRNAMEASPTGGTIRVFASCDLTVAIRPVRIRIQDQGGGLNAEAAEHLFDPFYSGRPAGRGLGFGLSKCWRIVTAHGGRIDVDHSVERGFGMLVDWPGVQC